MTGPRYFWLAWTAVWCIRRLHTPDQKLDPNFVCYGFSWGAVVVRTQVKCKRFIGGCFLSLFVRDVLVREGDIVAREGRVCAGTRFSLLPWRGSGMLEFVRDAFVRARYFTFITGLSRIPYITAGTIPKDTLKLYVVWIPQSDRRGRRYDKITDRIRKQDRCHCLNNPVLIPRGLPLNGGGYLETCLLR